MKNYLHKFFGVDVISPEEIEAVLKLPVLAVIPHFERRKTPKRAPDFVMRRVNPEGRWRSRLLTSLSPDMGARETYQTVLQPLLEMGEGEGRKKVFLFASSVGSEGTTLTCINLALAAAMEGVKTLVIEAHNRASRLSAAFKLTGEHGINDLITKNLPLEKAVRSTDNPLVDILPADRAVAYPQRLWESPDFDTVLEQVRAKYRLILVEGAPILLYPDTPILASKMDAAILVHQVGRSSAETVQKTLEKLNESGVPVLGLILNDAAQLM